MTTATFGEVAKLIGTNVDRLRENDKVCLICDAIRKKRCNQIPRKVQSKSLLSNK